MRLIDADALIKRLKEDWPQTSKISWAQIVAKCAPTIDTEPVKHGEWVRLEIKGIINPLTGKNRTYIGCSCCGEPIPTDSILDIIPEEEVNFCFGCGAKMDKE